MTKRILNGQRGTKKVPPETLALMLEQLPTVGSLRDLAALTGVRLDVVRREVAPFLAIMKLNGTHPKCGCGKDRFHPYGCVDSVTKASYSTPVRGRSLVEGLVMLARREPILEAIMTGDPYSVIEQRLNLPHKSARKYLIHLTPEQRAQRKQLEQERAQALSRKRKKLKPKTAPAVDPRPFRDPLYARIAFAVPRWVAPATRDDIISEMYVATQDGTLAVADIEANAKRFASQAVAMWESKFGPRSIDALTFDDGKRTLADILPDPTALAAFETLDDMRVGRRLNQMEAF